MPGEIQRVSVKKRLTSLFFGKSKKPPKPSTATSDMPNPIHRRIFSLIKELEDHNKLEIVPSVLEIIVQNISSFDIKKFCPEYLKSLKEENSTLITNFDGLENAKKSQNYDINNQRMATENTLLKNEVLRLRKIIQNQTKALETSECDVLSQNSNHNAQKSTFKDKDSSFTAQEITIDSHRSSLTHDTCKYTNKFENTRSLINNRNFSEVNLVRRSFVSLDLCHPQICHAETFICHACGTINDKNCTENNNYNAQDKIYDQNANLNKIRKICITNLQNNTSKLDSDDILRLKDIIAKCDIENTDNFGKSYNKDLDKDSETLLKIKQGKIISQKHILEPDGCILQKKHTFLCENCLKITKTDFTSIYTDCKQCKNLRHLISNNKEKDYTPLILNTQNVCGNSRFSKSNMSEHSISKTAQLHFCECVKQDKTDFEFLYELINRFLEDIDFNGQKINSEFKKSNENNFKVPLNTHQTALSSSRESAENFTLNSTLASNLPENDLNDVRNSTKAMLSQLNCQCIYLLGRMCTFSRLIEHIFQYLSLRIQKKIIKNNDFEKEIVVKEKAPTDQSTIQKALITTFKEQFKLCKSDQIFNTSKTIISSESVCSNSQNKTLTDLQPKESFKLANNTFIKNDSAVDLKKSQPKNNDSATEKSQENTTTNKTSQIQDSKEPPAIPSKATDLHTKLLSSYSKETGPESEKTTMHEKIVASFSKEKPPQKPSRPPPRRLPPKKAVVENPLVSIFGIKKYINLRWEKIEFKEKSIWALINTKMDMKHLLSVFTIDMMSPFEKIVETSSVVKEKPQFITVFPPKKGNAISIALGRLKCADNVFIEDILSFNAENIDENVIKQLIVFYPTLKEIQLLKDVKNANLGRAERFFVHCLENHEILFRNLKIIFFRKTFATLEQNIRSNINFLTNLYTSYLKSESVREFLTLILFIGNILNLNTAYGNCKAFKLSSMNRILEVVGKDVRLVDFVSVHMNNDLKKDLNAINSDRKVFYESVCNDMSEVDNNYAKIKTYVETKECALYLGDSVARFGELKLCYEKFMAVYVEYCNFFQNEDAVSEFGNLVANM